MAIRFVRAAGLSVLTVALLLAAALAVVAWRLTSGPIEADFLNSRVEAMANERLGGGRMTVQRTVLETDADSWIPTLRFVNVTFKDDEGTVIAQLPKLGVTLDRQALLTGTVAPSAVEIIGAKLNAARRFDGGFELGIDESLGPDENEAVEFNADQASRQDVPAPALPAKTSTPRLISFLDALLKDQRLSSLQDIRIQRAAVSFYDEVNDARWFAPQADVAITRNGNALDLVTTADVATSRAPWKARITAHYETGNPDIAVSTELADFIPADAAAKIFALSQLARVQNPVSGLVRFTINGEGMLKTAQADFTIGKGAISIPDFVAKPITIDGGRLQIIYDETTKHFTIGSSSLMVEGAEMAMSGTLSPLRDGEGKLTAVGISLKTVNAQNAVPLLVDNISFEGKAALEDQRLDIDDLVILQGQAGVRLRGALSGGDLSPGIQIAGRLRDINADLLKKLWPPILTPKTRAWVNEHVKAGRVSEGTFQVNLPPDALAMAVKAKAYQPGSVNLTFSFVDVTTGYFKNLAPMAGANGNATLIDNEFSLTLNGAKVALPSANSVTLQGATFKATRLLLEPVTGTFAFTAAGTMQSLVDFTAQPDLKILNLDLSTMPQLDGNVEAAIGLEFPMIKDVPKERVKFTTSLHLTSMAKNDIVKGVDLSEGDFTVGVTETDITASGPAKLNGVASKISWSKPRKSGLGTTIVETKLDKATQQRMGLKLDAYVNGTIPVKITATGGLGGTADVDADLSRVSMKIDALNWSREPTDGTSASLRISTTQDGGRKIEGISIKGPGLAIAGDAIIDAGNTFRSAHLTKVRLSEELDFAAHIKPGENGAAISLEGATFDARPYIKAAITPGPAAQAVATAKGPPLSISAQLGKVYAFRGEILQNVAAELVTSGGKLRSASIKGTFLNGQPLTFRMTPIDGGRDMRVSSLDGGAALRAANFYSKVAGGALEFSGRIADAAGSPIRNGQLVLRRFEVRNEAALAELDKRGKPKKSGPRREGMYFKKLVLPFTTDSQYFRLNDVELGGNDMGMVAKGTVRKGDGALCITGTMIPAQGINGGFIEDLPIFGQLLTGGSGEGIIGITFALGGTINKPKYQVNPLSALAPGFLRKFFEFQIPKAACGTAPVADGQY